ncbi:hypothetical protein CK203_062792 [Vitis vinifera]|uniref:Reverse transcriptase Ty1/copia-type domain-containing protein n=1 Tax=Vitis vinifera TaxID=29760 RepID=A0A438GB89_VITVI|nr:hypothetical protein CK203_062792 [Vitis vinifera]
MVVEESIHVIFDESNNSLQERESFDDDLGLATSMGKLQIEDRRQQEEIVEDPKKEESPLALPPPQQVQGESSQDLPKDWKFVINHPQDQIIEFSKCMHSKFEMSMIAELNFFLGLQIKQLKEKTFINQAKCIRDLLKRFNMEEAKTMKTPMSSSIKLDKDEKGDNFELIGFSDVDFAGCKVERKSTSDTCHFLGHSLVFMAYQMGCLPVVTIFEPIFPTLVRAFYSRVTYGLEGPIISTVRGVEIRLRRRVFAAFSTFLQLDSGCMSPRCLGDGQTIGTQLDRVQPSPSSHDLLHLFATRWTSRQARPEYFSMTTSLLKYSRMSGSRRHPMAPGLGELSDLQHKLRDRDRCILE